MGYSFDPIIPRDFVIESCIGITAPKIKQVRFVHSCNAGRLIDPTVSPPRPTVSPPRPTVYTVTAKAVALATFFNDRLGCTSGKVG